MNRIICYLIGMTMSVLPGAALADALVVTRAMKASTIVEVFIEDEQVRAEIEVGTADLLAFADLLPDELFEKLTGQKQPLADRQPTFFQRDWLIGVGDAPLDGHLEQAVVVKRLARDEITGAPLASQPADAEVVVQIRLRYPLPGRPAAVTLRPPRDAAGRTSANIGFVVYHRGVAVNDFRYLSQPEILRLDWSDPWYSRFENKTLWRRYAAPAAAFLYVENFEVRKEIVFRARDLQDWLDLGLAGRAVIPSNERDAVRAKAAAFLHQHSPLKIDGQAATGRLDRVHFITRTLRTSGVLEPGQDIDVDTALLGVIYVYAVESLPRQVSMDWDLFNERITRVPTVASDEAGGLPSYLEPADPKLVWQNYLTNPTPPGFLEVPLPPEPRRLPVPVGSLLCLAVVVVAWTRRQRCASATRPSPVPVVIGSLLLIGAAALGARRMTLEISVPGAKRPPISIEEAGSITGGLLRNLYRAFDYPEERRVYEVLDRSVSGDLLTRVYLETRRSLTLASQGGARVKVNEVELFDCQPRPMADSGGFTARSTWTVGGSVGHWGHIHQRVNQYQADFVIVAVDGQWKITNMEITSGKRL